ncbi:MAG: hypothetical protein ACT4OX_04895 [Actinomycetota bacterium]
MIALVAACSGNDEAAAPPPRPPVGYEQPVIELIRDCGECTRVEVMGEPATAVYADGRVVRVESDVDDDTGVWTVRYFRDRIDDAAFDRLLVLAAEAGLIDGHEVSFPNPEAALDAGGLSLVGRLDGVTATFTGPYLSDDELDGAPTQLQAATRLDAALSNLEDVVVTPMRAPRSVIVGERDDAGLLDGADARPWSGGSPLAELLSPVPGDAFLRCAIVDSTIATQVGRGAQRGFVYESAGDLWWLRTRPLLPHEQDCAEVVATAASS